MGTGWKGDGGANELGRKNFHVCSIIFQNVSWGPNHVILKWGVVEISHKDLSSEHFQCREMFYISFKIGCLGSFPGLPLPPFSFLLLSRIIFI